MVGCTAEYSIHDDDNFEDDGLLGGGGGVNYPLSFGDVGRSNEGGSAWLAWIFLDQIIEHGVATTLQAHTIHIKCVYGTAVALWMHRLCAICLLYGISIYVRLSRAQRQIIMGLSRSHQPWLKRFRTPLTVLPRSKSPCVNGFDGNLIISCIYKTNPFCVWYEMDTRCER